MDSELLFKFLSSIGLLVIGYMAKTSNSEGWQPVKKYWMFFVIVGGISLLYAIYKYLAR